MVDYGSYKLNWKELVREIGTFFLVMGVLGQAFYGRFYYGFLFFPGLRWWLKKKQKEYGKKRQQQLLEEFKIVLEQVESSLKVGYSPENSWRESLHEIRILEEKEGVMEKELTFFCNQLDNGRTLEEILLNFGERSKVKEIKEFASIFSMSVRGGGDLIKILENTVEILNKKMEVARDIGILIAGKKMESTIMSLMPAGMLLYINWGAKEFLQVLYQTLWGKMLMTLCLLFYLGTIFMSQKIIEIKA